MNFKLWLENNILPIENTPLINGAYHFTGKSEESPNFLNDINPLRIATKQSKPNKQYGGFYIGPLDHAKLYGGIGYKINLKPNTTVLYNPEQIIDRITINQIQDYQNQNIDVLWGKDVRGKPQGIITNKNAIQNINKLKDIP